MRDVPQISRLARECAALLESGRRIVEGLPAEIYARQSTVRAPGEGGIGAHLRHCLDCYACLFAGREAGRVDYDRRMRDAAIEREAARGAEALASTIDLLENDAAHWPDVELLVRMDEAQSSEDRGWVRSSLGRELRFLSTHTIHHFAMIARELAEAGIEVDPNFGVAPATQQFRRRAPRGGPRAKKRVG